MKASFVIPVHNGSAYLAETLDSCVQQKLKDIEIIVVDDGSDDRTVGLINYFIEKDRRIVLIKHDVNKGRSEARNTGIEAATSDIILTSDADDLSHPMRAGDTVNYFKKFPDVDIVTTRAQVIDPLGNIGGVLPTQPFSWKNVTEKKMTYIVHSSMAFKKKVFEKVQFTSGDYSKNAIDDWKFQVDAYKAGFKFGYLNKTLVQYRYIPKPRDEKKILELKELCLG